MGTHNVVAQDDSQDRAFSRSLVRDLRALERMLGEGLIERGVHRVGAEQELFIVDQDWRPADLAIHLLEEIDDPRYTTELALFNLEINVPPLELAPRLFSTLEERLTSLIDRARDAAAKHQARLLLTGILPTLAPSDLTLARTTPKPRYFALNDTIMAMAGGRVLMRARGIDELRIEHDSVMLEACNTSFQLHWQVDAEEFARVYNIAQTIVAPVLAAAVNSPLLFGKRLWAETRIAVFQQAMDTRASSGSRELRARVHFGDRWVRESIVEIFEDDLARLPTILASTEEGEDSLRVVQDGRIPSLNALQTYNSTVYRWVRTCYGVGNGVPHLRIECRALPSGPTVLDEVANAAFWIGLLRGMADEYGDITRAMQFGHARANFYAAARYGLQAGFSWCSGMQIPARELILDHLLPFAESGLGQLGIDPEETERYLGIIEQRVETGQTGAYWMLEAAGRMGDTAGRAERLATLAAATAAREGSGQPVHRWEPGRFEEGAAWRQHFTLVEHCMTTDLYTIQEDKPLDLAAFLIERQKVRQIFVEDAEHRLKGVVSFSALLRFLATDERHGGSEAVPVREVMDPDPPTVAPETPTLDAIRLMRERSVPTLPVVREGRLVGVISEHDFMPIVAHLLEERQHSGER